MRAIILILAIAVGTAALALTVPWITGGPPRKPDHAKAMVSTEDNYDVDTYEGYDTGANEGYELDYHGSYNIDMEEGYSAETEEGYDRGMDEEYDASKDIAPGANTHPGTDTAPSRETPLHNSDELGPSNN